jgi:opacity protein-like surface antigen
MKRLTTKPAFIAITALCIGMSAYAQIDRAKYEFGINLGFLVYQGDLTPEQLGSFKTQKLSLGLHASKILNPSFSLRANLAFGKLKGDDAKYASPEFRQQRNFNFTTPVTELTGQLVWNVTGRNYDDKGFSPYVFAGAGFAFLKIKRDWSNINVDYFGGESGTIWAGLAADSAHKLPKIIPVIPVGAGIKYFFTPKWAVNAETSYRIATTDYLDGFSQSANPSKKDNYMGYSVGIIYRSGKPNRLACPVVRY